MKIHEIMNRDVELIPHDSPVIEAARRMRELDIGSLPVSDPSRDRLVGMITDRDLVIRCMAVGCDPHRTQVRDVMTSPITYCFEDNDVGDVAHLMEDRSIRRVVVMNRDKRLVGILSLDDLARNRELAGEVLARLTEAMHQDEAA